MKDGEIMSNYSLNDYLNDIKKKGLKKTWNTILSKTLKNTFVSDIFKLENYGELYEIGLELENKISKKELGKYYTPKDVAKVMVTWLKKLDGENICDIGCGVGNLILNYLDSLSFDDAYRLLENGNIYLYDIDEVALNICKYSLAIKYGKEILKKIHIKKCDFLDKNIKIPKNSKVISNPPYHRISEISDNWKNTKIIRDSKELYSSFMEKIILNSSSSVIITPYSFIGSTKFFSLRKLMNNYNGFVVSFDNVPGNIFNGRKHGIFNSNKGNSVRAAITVVENKSGYSGFRISPLIRFRSEERERMLNNAYLESLINDEYQIVDKKHPSYFKCSKNLLKIFENWESKSTKRMHDFLSSKSPYTICVPTTCRYFTVGAKKNLQRDGKRTLFVKEKKYYNYIYAMLNSSFAYWYWRIYDGGINCPLTIINNIPMFYDLLNDVEKKELDLIVEDMQKSEKKYLVYKLNAGKNQENIKFPHKYRDKINKIFLEALGLDEKISIMEEVHSSSLFMNLEEEQEYE